MTHNFHEGLDVEYAIVVDTNSGEGLSWQVNEMLKAGWMLQGGVSCSASESDEYFYVIFIQAMIRNKINSKSEEGESNE